MQRITLGKLVINPQFDEVGTFDNEVGLTKVRLGGKYGYIDRTGKFAINPQFDRAQNFVPVPAPVIIGNAPQSAEIAVAIAPKAPDPIPATIGMEPTREKSNTEPTSPIKIENLSVSNDPELVEVNGIVRNVGTKSFGHVSVYIDLVDSSGMVVSQFVEPFFDIAPGTAFRLHSTVPSHGSGLTAKVKRVTAF